MEIEYKRVEKIIKMEAIAWIRKYLIEFSVFWLFNLIRSRGINLIKLISSPIQAISQEEAEQVKIVPKINEGI